MALSALPGFPVNVDYRVNGTEKKRKSDLAGKRLSAVQLALKGSTAKVEMNAS
jgi:hypothetical protein